MTTEAILMCLSSHFWQLGRERISERMHAPFWFISLRKLLSILLTADFVVLHKHMQTILLGKHLYTRPDMILCWNIYLFPRYNYDQDRRWSKPPILKWPTSCKTMNLISEQNIKCGIHKCKHSNCKILSKKFLSPSTAPFPL